MHLPTRTSRPSFAVDMPAPAPVHHLPLEVARCFANFGSIVGSNVLEAVRKLLMSHASVWIW